MVLVTRTCGYLEKKLISVHDFGCLATSAFPVYASLASFTNESDGFTRNDEFVIFGFSKIFVRKTHE